MEDDVALKFYRLQKISEGAIDLKAGEPDPLKGPTEVGTGTSHGDDVSLSSLINMLNERFGTQFTPADQLFFDQVTETAAANEKLQEAARVNTTGKLLICLQQDAGRPIYRADGGKRGDFYTVDERRLLPRPCH
ncbi:MAG: hypothetical protein M5U35_00200 [Roseovarius sp.]|nr:hypothetical protein [Roseovarius sp.]